MNHTTVGAAYYIPGIVATIAVILMACISRDDSDGYVGYDDEGDTVSISRSRLHAELHQSRAVAACNGLQEGQ